MKFRIKLFNVLAPVLATAILAGCGGDDSAAVPEVQPISEETVAAPSPAKKKKKTTTARKTGRSAMDRIDDALDDGNYMAAVDIAIKSGSSADENMDNLRYVQTELGDAMARGDRRAHEAYQKLNAFYIMRHQR